MEGLRSAMMRVQRRTIVWCIRDALVKKRLEENVASPRKQLSTKQQVPDTAAQSSGASVESSRFWKFARLVEHKGLSRAGFSTRFLRLSVFSCGICLGFKPLVLGLLIRAKLYREP